MFAGFPSIIMPIYFSCSIYVQIFYNHGRQLRWNRKHCEPGVEIGRKSEKGGVVPPDCVRAQLIALVLLSTEQPGISVPL